MLVSPAHPSTCPWLASSLPHICDASKQSGAGSLDVGVIIIIIIVNNSMYFIIIDFMNCSVNFE